MEEGRSGFSILIDEPTGKRVLGRHRPRSEGNIRLDFNEIGFISRNLVDLVQDSDY